MCRLFHLILLGFSLLYSDDQRARANFIILLHSPTNPRSKKGMPTISAAPAPGPLLPRLLTVALRPKTIGIKQKPAPSRIKNRETTTCSTPPGKKPFRFFVVCFTLESVPSGENARRNHVLPSADGELLFCRVRWKKHIGDILFSQLKMLVVTQNLCWTEIKTRTSCSLKCVL